jgi:hypothetical protein
MSSPMMLGGWRGKRPRDTVMSGREKESSLNAGKGGHCTACSDALERDLGTGMRGGLRRPTRVSRRPWRRRDAAAFEFWTPVCEPGVPAFEFWGLGQPGASAFEFWRAAQPAGPAFELWGVSTASRICIRVLGSQPISTQGFADMHSSFRAHHDCGTGVTAPRKGSASWPKGETTVLQSSFHRPMVTRQQNRPRQTGRREAGIRPGWSFLWRPGSRHPPWLRREHLCWFVDVTGACLKDLKTFMARCRAF